MSGTSGHHTSSIPRRKIEDDESHSLARRRRHRREPSLIRPPRSYRHVGSLAGIAAVLSIAAMLFVIPFRTWLNQRAELSKAKDQLELIESVNARLADDNRVLGTSEGIETAARVDLGYKRADETSYAVLPPPAIPDALPAGWTYDMVNQILAVRASAPPATTAP